MGLASLRVLACVVKATTGLRWKEGDGIENIFAEVDADISQALQSSREELDSGRVVDVAAAKQALVELRTAIKDSQREIQSWQGVYPFERAAASLDFWKL